MKFFIGFFLLIHHRLGLALEKTEKKAEIAFWIGIDSMPDAVWSLDKRPASVKSSVEIDRRHLWSISGIVDIVTVRPVIDVNWSSGEEKKRSPAGENEITSQPWPSSSSGIPTFQGLPSWHLKKLPPPLTTDSVLFEEKKTQKMLCLCFHSFTRAQRSIIKWRKFRPQLLRCKPGCWEYFQ